MEFTTTPSSFPCHHFREGELSSILAGSIIILKRETEKRRGDCGFEKKEKKLKKKR